jgi:hypothetical protein
MAALPSPEVQHPASWKLSNRLDQLRIGGLTISPGQITVDLLIVSSSGRQTWLSALPVSRLPERTPSYHSRSAWGGDIQ